LGRIRVQTGKDEAMVSVPIMGFRIVALSVVAGVLLAGSGCSVVRAGDAHEYAMGLFLLAGSEMVRLLRSGISLQPGV